MLLALLSARRVGGPAETLRADEVVVSAGAIHTPALLMRSGIGPGAALQKHGIAVVAALEGVGANLMEHPSTAVSTYLPPAMRLADLDEHHDHAILRFSSGVEGTPEGDMHAAMIARSGWHAVGQRIGTLFIWVNKPFSRGAVTLAGTGCAARAGGRFPAAVGCAGFRTAEAWVPDGCEPADA